MFQTKTITTQVQYISEVIEIWSPSEFSEELQQLQEMARRFCREEIMPLAAHHDQTGEVRWNSFRGKLIHRPESTDSEINTLLLYMYM